VALLHSQLTRMNGRSVHRIRRGEARVVGTPLGGVAPMVKLGLIIVDESMTRATSRRRHRGITGRMWR